LEKIYDVVIVGAGPAGLTAGIYTGRGNLSTLILEKEGIGSMIMTHQIDNYPGYHIGASGKERAVFLCFFGCCQGSISSLASFHFETLVSRWYTLL